jgi:hypothetical protein
MLRMIVCVATLVEFGFDLRRARPRPTGDSVRRFAPATFHLFVTAV